MSRHRPAYSEQYPSTMPVATALGTSTYSKTTTDTDSTLRSSHGRPRRSMTSPQAGPEDLFYSLANAESPRDQHARRDARDKQRSRPPTSGHQWPLPDSRQARPTSSARSAAPGFATRNSTSRDGEGNLANSSPFMPTAAYDRPTTRSGSQRATPASHSRFASADWATRFPRPAPPSRQTSDQDTLRTPVLRADSSSRRPSLAGNGTLTPTQGAAYRSDQSPFDVQARDASQLDVEADDGDSPVSTTAPSTVWDELGELKTRIRKLELTGSSSRRRPSTVTTPSYADYSDRPRTGTTQTTDLTSPNPSHLISPKQAQTEELHPLLREALGKARSRLDPNTYRFLESSAFDSLELASMVRGLDSGMSDNMSAATGATTAGSVERRVRRKADNVCRSLTELCIALCEGKAPGSNTQAVASPSREKLVSRPGSRDQLVTNRPISRDRLVDRSAFTNGNSPVDVTELRRARTERLDAASRPSPRLASRLDSRRSSAADIMDSDTASAYSRPAMRQSFAHAASNTGYGDANDDNDATLRGPSRAMTEIFTRERPSRQLSDGFASRYAPQNQTSNGVSPSIRERLMANRSNNSLLSNRSLTLDTNLLASPTSEAPVERNSFDSGTSTATGIGRRPSASRRAPPSAAANLAERLEAKRQQRVASAGQLGNATPTSAVSGSLAGLRRPGSSGRT